MRAIEVRRCATQLGGAQTIADVFGQVVLGQRDRLARLLGPRPGDVAPMLDAESEAPSKQFHVAGLQYVRATDPSGVDERQADGRGPFGAQVVNVRKPAAGGKAQIADDQTAARAADVGDDVIMGRVFDDRGETTLAQKNLHQELRGARGFVEHNAFHGLARDVAHEHHGAHRPSRRDGDARH